METKIDLTKCNNYRYKARIDGNEDYGRICVENGGLAFLRSDKEDGYIATWHTDIPVIEGMCGRKVTDFEIIPRDQETYKDWQVGDRCYQPDEDDYIGIMEVIFRSGELVVLKDEDDIVLCFTIAQMEKVNIILELTDIEKQIIEEKKKAEWKPQDGDIIAFGYKAVGIFRNFERLGYHRDYVTLTAGRLSFNEGGWTSDKLYPATEEEKQSLFREMAIEGKRWNAEKKVVEGIPKPCEFKKGEPVLVRSDYGRDWMLVAYVELSSNPDAVFGKYGVTDGRSTIFYRFCLPYNEKTMHLLGTDEDYKEE